MGFKISFILLIVFLGGGVISKACANSYSPAKISDIRDTSSKRQVREPFKKWNHSVFKFNRTMDHFLFSPINQMYTHAVPCKMQYSIHNFLRNLREPLNLINALLQLNPQKVANTIGRMLVNTTWGIGGLGDVAGYAGLAYKEESFGKSTLRSYGVRPGAYLILPILGPSSVRDTIGLLGDTALNPFSYILTNKELTVETAALIVDENRQVLPMLKDIEEVALDEYATIKSLYMQKYR